MKDVLIEEAASGLLRAELYREHGSQWGGAWLRVSIRGMRTCAGTGPVRRRRGQEGRELQGLLF